MEEKNAVSFVLIVTKVTKHIFTKFFGTRIAGGGTGGAIGWGSRTTPTWLNSNQQRSSKPVSGGE